LRPLIVVTTSRRERGPAGTNPVRERPARPEAWLLQDYLDCVVGNGGLPVALAPVEGVELELASWAADNADGVVISGGVADILPHHYGEQPRAAYPEVDDPRAIMELELARLCARRGIPTLGVCGGLQVMAVALGGTLYQDLAVDRPELPSHEQANAPSGPSHEVLLRPGLLRQAFGAERILVNSTHRQALRELGRLQVAGRSPDGVVEAAVLPGHPWYVGVQWHPEALDGALYPQLCAAAQSVFNRRSRP